MNTSEDKIAKSKIIDGMLAELEMSKQDLIDLIKAITEPEKTQGVEVIELQQGAEADGLPQSVGAEQLAEYIANGNTEYLSKYLSLEQLKELSIRIGFANSLKRAKAMGLMQDNDEIALLLELENIKSLNPNGRANINGKETNLSQEKISKLANDINNIINSRSQAAYQTAQQRSQSAQIINDPNDLSNQNSSVNIVKKVMSVISSQMQALGLSSGSGISSGLNSSSLQQQQQQQDQQQQIRQMQQVARRIERVNSQMRKHKREMQKMFPELGGKISANKKGEITATVRTKSGEQQVNLKDYLKENNKLNPKAEKLLNNFANANSKLEQGLEQLSKGLPTAKSFQFDSTGRMQVDVEDKEKVKTHNIADYLNDLRRDIEQRKNKVETKKSELESKKGQLEGDMERLKQKTKGPELESVKPANADFEERRLDALKHSQTAANKEGATTEKTERTESKRVGDELVKLDALHDKEKMLQSVKGTSEMKAIESSMKDVMKHMEEAQQNKDLLDTMKKDFAKGKFIDKL